MGYELVAFSSKDEAAKFSLENGGKWIVQLHEVANQNGTPGAESFQTPENSGVADRTVRIPADAPGRNQLQDPQSYGPITPPAPVKQFIPSAPRGGGCWVRRRHSLSIFGERMPESAFGKRLNEVTLRALTPIRFGIPKWRAGKTPFDD
jgi:hypothetical protein